MASLNSKITVSGRVFSFGLVGVIFMMSSMLFEWDLRRAKRARAGAEEHRSLASIESSKRRIAELEEDK